MIEAFACAKRRKCETGISGIRTRRDLFLSSQVFLDGDSSAIPCSMGHSGALGEGDSVTALFRTECLPLHEFSRQVDESVENSRNVHLC